MENFFLEDIPVMIKPLGEDSKPDWGIMTPQHMIEHVTSGWLISNGRFESDKVPSEEKIEKRLEFLYSNRPFPRNITNMAHGDGLRPLRRKNLSDAKEQLLKNIQLFFDHHKEKQDYKPLHPVFGYLDKEGWLVFQKKHITHHFIQFGLMKDILSEN